MVALLPTETRAIQRQSLAALRWTVVLGQLITVLVVQNFLGITLPLLALLPLWLAAIAANTLFALNRQALTERELLLHLIADSALLAVSLHLTGGLQNPFAAILLIYPTIAAAVFNRRRAAIMGGVTAALLTVLAFYHEPLPWRDGQGLLLDRLYSCGVWTALMLGAMFIITVVQRLVDAARQTQQQLRAAQAALARQQRVAALGGLAADAAHQLSTPLNTITLIAHELLDDGGLGTTARQNATALLQQAQGCKTILAQLAARAQSPVTTIRAVNWDTWWRELCQQQPNGRSDIVVQWDVDPALPPVIIPDEATQAVAQIWQNACRHAHRTVTVTVLTDTARCCVMIADDGDGLPGNPVLGLVPQPESTHGGMGLGLFIARGLVEQIGGTIEFTNGKHGGTLVRLTWSHPKALE